MANKAEKANDLTLEFMDDNYKRVDDEELKEQGKYEKELAKTTEKGTIIEEPWMIEALKMDKQIGLEIIAEEKPKKEVKPVSYVSSTENNL